MNKYLQGLWSSVAMAPDGIEGMPNFIPIGGPGAGSGEIIESGVQGGGQTQQQPLIGQESNEEDPLDFMSAFQELDEDGDPIQTGEPDDTGDGPFKAEDIPADRVKGVETEVMNSIKKMGAGKLPDGFDASDPAQLQGVLDRTVQAAVAQTMQVVFKPVQLALEHALGQMSKQMDSKISSARSGMQAQSILETVVPEINDPKYRDMVMSMDNTLKQKGKKPHDRAKTLRKMLNQMGVQSSGDSATRRSTGGTNPGGPTMRTGKAALDSFFGEFKLPQAQNGQR